MNSHVSVCWGVGHVFVCGVLVMYLCVGVLILHISTIYPLDFRIVPMVIFVPFHYMYNILHHNHLVLILPYTCKTLIDVQSSNPCPILRHRHLYFFKFSNQRSILKYTCMSFFKFSNRCPILKYMAVSHFLKSTYHDVCPNHKQ